MTVKEIEAVIYDRLSLSVTPTSATAVRIRRHLNMAHRSLLARRQMQVYRRGRVNFTTYEGSPISGIPSPISRVRSIYDIGRGTFLTPRTLQSIREQGLEWGDPREYDVISYSGATMLQPPTFLSEVITAVSSSALDDATRAIVIQGIDSDGMPISAAIPMNGTTPVTPLPVYTNWRHITKIALNDIAVGVISIYRSQIPTLIAQIPPLRTSARYLQVFLYPTPVTATLLSADVDFKVEDLVEYDVPLLPEDHHEILVDEVLIREYELREDQLRYEAALARKRERWRDLCDHALTVPTPPNQQPGWSQLGPYYPEGS